MENHGRTEDKRNPRRVLLHILGEIDDNIPNGTPTRAATAASAARLLMRLLAGETERQGR